MPSERSTKMDRLLDLVGRVHGEPVHTIDMAIALLERKAAQRQDAEEAWGKPERMPAAGERARTCPHLEELPLTECVGAHWHHWPSKPHEPWLILCDACHEHFPAKPVQKVRRETRPVPPGIRLEGVGN